jgi:hypothetical protein
VQGKVKTHKYINKLSQQPENCENRNDPDLVQAFLKKWWVDFVLEKYSDCTYDQKERLSHTLHLKRALSLG